MVRLIEIKKLKKQKGTGTARFGSIKSPLFKGGGRVFGPQPREYGFKLNKKLKKLARQSALTYKARENGIIVMEDFTLESPKTKNFVSLLKNFDLQGKKVLMVLAGNDKNVYLSSRNIQKTKITDAASINTYDILNANSIIVAESSLKEIEKIHSVN